VQSLVPFITIFTSLTRQRSSFISFQVHLSYQDIRLLACIGQQLRVAGAGIYLNFLLTCVIYQLIAFLYMLIQADRRLFSRLQTYAHLRRSFTPYTHAHTSTDL
jgi:hypothetical protein